jgi:tetratricopeptide (TPR) repeat protein
VAEITVEMRTRECDALINAAVAARREPEARVVALRACVAHPCAYHQFDLPELHRTLGETLARLERYDESIEAWESAIAAGDRSVPHPRASVGEVLLQAGRKDEAAVLFAELRRRCPRDIWLRNAAGFSYAWVGDYAAAQPWLDEGVRMALADGDAEGILAQLEDERSRCRTALGLAHDDVSAQVAKFQSQSERPAFASPPKEMFGDATPDRSPCSHCGWDERDEPATAIHLDEAEWLLVEGVTDVRVFQQLLSKYGVRHEVVIVPLGGDDLAAGDHHGQELAELCRLSDKVFAIVDSERTAEGAGPSSRREKFRKACEAQGVVCHLLERRAIENYLDQKIARDVFHRPQVADFSDHEQPGPAWSWAKERNWRVAMQMDRSHLAGTDLDKHLVDLAAAATAAGGA